MERSVIKVAKEEIARYVKIDTYVKFKRKVMHELKNALNNNHRLLIVLSGDDSKKLAILVSDLIILFVRRMAGYKNVIKILYVHHNEFSDAVLRQKLVNRIVSRYLRGKELGAKLDISVYENSERFLGTTYQGIILDLINSLRPIDIGRLIGIVEGGGILVLLTPKWSEWASRKNLFQTSLTTPQHPEPRKIFINWFQSITLDSDGVFIYDVDEEAIIKTSDLKSGQRYRKFIEIPEGTRFPTKLYELALTQDQVKAVSLMENLIALPRKPAIRTSVVLIADRGRGKSCAIGIGLVGLIHSLMNVKNKVRIGVTAPTLNNVQSLMDLATKALEALAINYNVIRKGGLILEIKGDKFSIEYWEPAVLNRINVDIAVVDEAAGIPVPLLHSIWQNFRRTIFATTIHGYEGAGRGFSIRFMKRMKEDRETNLYVYEMEEPIRYGKHDPVERWQFRVLLLDAEPDGIMDEDLDYIEKQEFSYIEFNPHTLFTIENEKVLRSLFGIYILAHYRNEPDDLAIMADAPHHSIRALALPNNKIIAAAQLAEEGPIPTDYMNSLIRGGKIPGNIIPDRLLKHGRIVEVGYGKGWRIVRIAVHPSVQGRGIGTYFLKKLVEEAESKGYDWIGSGFGATEELVHFWIKNGFIPLHISPDRNPVSAEYTILVIKPLSNLWEDIVRVLNREFRVKLIESLHDTYRDLEAEVAQMLLSLYKIQDAVEKCTTPSLTPIQLERIASYVEGYMTYESCSDVISMLIKHYWRNVESCRILDRDEEIITILKSLQGHPWDIVSRFSRTKKQELLDYMKKIVWKLLRRYYSFSEDDIDSILGRTSIKLYYDTNTQCVQGACNEG
ncbi:MAG: tRNA(Met) cytidine acetyltransferase TmcA [Ignisphaera sp.]|nr:tRNA(Met) cytidine acetyltransferase TmcA [Ignisphaera sp.]